MNNKNHIGIKISNKNYIYFKFNNKFKIKIIKYKFLKDNRKESKKNDIILINNKNKLIKILN